MEGGGGGDGPRDDEGSRKRRWGWGTAVREGRVRLRRMLAETKDPPRAIHDFREAHRVPFKSCEGPVEMLALMKLSRGEAYAGLLEGLVRSVEMDRIPAMTEAARTRLLKQSFPFISVPELRAIPVALLRRLHQVPDVYLDELGANADLREVVATLPLHVQHRVWERPAGAALFRHKLLPFAEAYCKDIGVRVRQCTEQLRVLGSPRLLQVARWRTESKDMRALLELLGGRAGLVLAACRAVVDTMRSATTDHEAQEAWAVVLVDMLLAVQAEGGARLAPPPALARLLRVASALDLLARQAPQAGDQEIRGLQEAIRAVFPDPVRATHAPAPAPKHQHRQQAKKPGGAGPRGKSALATAALKDILRAAWQQLSELDEQNVFALPVSEAEAPGYGATIKKPMDLSTMRAKLDRARGGYSSLDELEKDVTLMINNCVAFNGAVSEFGQYAKSFLAKWELVLPALRKKAAATSASSPAAAPTSAATATAAAASASSRPPASRATTATPQAADMVKEQSSVGNDGRWLAFDGKVEEAEQAPVLAMLSHPGARAALILALAARLEDCLRHSLLPRMHVSLPSVLQLLQIFDLAPATLRSCRCSIPAPSEPLLRCSLPRLLLFLGDPDLGVTRPAASSLSSSSTSPASSSPDPKLPPHLSSVAGSHARWGLLEAAVEDLTNHRQTWDSLFDHSAFSSPPSAQSSSSPSSAPSSCSSSCSATASSCSACAAVAARLVASLLRPEDRSRAHRALLLLAAAAPGRLAHDPAFLDGVAKVCLSARAAPARDQGLRDDVVIFLAAMVERWPMAVGVYSAAAKVMQAWLASRGGRPGLMPPARLKPLADALGRAIASLSTAVRQERRPEELQEGDVSSPNVESELKSHKSIEGAGADATPFKNEAFQTALATFDDVMKQNAGVSPSLASAVVQCRKAFGGAQAAAEMKVIQATEEVGNAEVSMNSGDRGGEGEGNGTKDSDSHQSSRDGLEAAMPRHGEEADREMDTDPPLTEGAGAPAGHAKVPKLHAFSQHHQ